MKTFKFTPAVVGVVALVGLSTSFIVRADQSRTTVTCPASVYCPSTHAKDCTINGCISTISLKGTGLGVPTGYPQERTNYHFNHTEYIAPPKPLKAGKSAVIQCIYGKNNDITLEMKNTIPEYGQRLWVNPEKWEEFFCNQIHTLCYYRCSGTPKDCSFYNQK